MPHMLPMPASQIRHPVTMFILMVANDRLIHSGLLPFDLPGERLASSVKMRDATAD